MVIGSGCTQVVGAVLAGGESRRMGPQSKPFAPFLGKALIDHAVERLGAQVDRVIVNINDGGEHAFGVPVVPDLNAELKGPLGGVFAVLSWLTGSGAAAPRALFTVPCDMPLLPADFVQRLSTAMEQNGRDCAFASYGGQGHYVCAALPMRAKGILDRRLRDGKFEMRDCLKELDAIEVDFPPAPIAPFSDLNTLEKLREMERLAGRDLR